MKHAQMRVKGMINEISVREQQGVSHLGWLRKVSEPLSKGVHSVREEHSSKGTA